MTQSQPETLEQYRAMKRELWRVAQGRCEACGAVTGLFDPEHAQGRRVAGAHDLDNVWLSCRRCHSMKTAAYVHGRLRVLPLGGGLFRFQLWKGASKMSCEMIREWDSLPRVA